MANPLQTVNNQIQAKCVELGDKALFFNNSIEHSFNFFLFEPVKYLDN